MIDALLVLLWMLGAIQPDDRFTLLAPHTRLLLALLIPTTPPVTST
jgi:hypothetical protein